MAVEHDPILFRKTLPQQTPELFCQVANPIIMHPLLCDLAGHPKANNQMATCNRAASTASRAAAPAQCVLDGLPNSSVR